METLNNFSSIYCFISFIIGAVIMFVALAIAAMGKVKEPRNKVHFYVARDMDDRIYLYLGKPQRRNIEFSTNSNCKFIATEEEFKKFNLKVENFKNLKWEDEPVEVFINFEVSMKNRKVIKSTNTDCEEDYSYLDEDEYMSLCEIQDMMW